MLVLLPAVRSDVELGTGVALPSVGSVADPRPVQRPRSGRCRLPAAGGAGPRDA
ncbi:hypothetical protein GCM10027440_20980 [Nocardiopsis coralliicola]